MTKLDEFRAQLRRLSEKWNQEMFSTEPVPELFHYCNATGLHGIVAEKCLWASDIFSLNDASEVDYAMQLVSGVVEKYVSLKPIAERIRDGTFMTVYKTLQAHVCCFSSEKDSLSQWRAYGAGGYGFAIGFNYNLLADMATTNGFILVPIQYSEDQQRKCVDGFSREASALLSAHGLESATLQEVAYPLLTLMAPIKNPAFRDEREWRILCVSKPDPDIYFRPMHGAIVPYSKISLKDAYFTRIVQGPTLHKEFGERSLKIFLAHRALADVKVESSVIPLRSL